MDYTHPHTHTPSTHTTHEHTIMQTIELHALHEPTASEVLVSLGESLLECGLIADAHAFFAEALYCVQEGLTAGVATPINASVAVRCHTGMALILFVEGRGSEGLQHIRAILNSQIHPLAFITIVRLFIWLTSNDSVVVRKTVQKMHTADSEANDGVTNETASEELQIISAKDLVPTFLTSLSQATTNLTSLYPSHTTHAQFLSAYVTALRASFSLTTVHLHVLASISTHQAYKDALALTEQAVSISSSIGPTLLHVHLLLYLAFLLFRQPQLSINTESAPQTQRRQTPSALTDGTDTHILSGHCAYMDE